MEAAYSLPLLRSKGFLSSSQFWISFTQLFVQKIYEGDTLFECYRRTKEELLSMELPFSLHRPRLSEGIPLASTQVRVGGDFVTAELAPDISGTSPRTFIDAGTVRTFYADISYTGDIDRVWAVVLPPEYTPPPVSQGMEAQVAALPAFDLTDPDKNGRYEGVYGNFTYSADYRITFYAQDDSGNISFSPATIVTVQNGEPLEALKGDVNLDRVIDLKDAVAILQVLTGNTPSGVVSRETDVNGDGLLGSPEAVYILQKISNLTEQGSAD